MGKIITIKEAAERLGKTEQTIRNWVRDGHVKASYVGKAVYIDEAIIDAMMASASDIERAERFMAEMYAERRQEVRAEQEARNDRVERRRFMNIAYFNAAQTGFFETVLGLLHAYGEINDREMRFMMMRLYDEPYGDIGEKFGLTRERVRQVLEKAYRKCRYSVDEIKNLLDEARDLKAQNDMLIESNQVLRERIKQYDDKKEEEEEPVDEETYRLLTTSIFDINISVRTLHILMALDVKTVADMCKVTRGQFLACRNAGKKSWAELEDFIADHGLVRGTDYSNIIISRIK